MVSTGKSRFTLPRRAVALLGLLVVIGVSVAWYVFRPPAADVPHVDLAGADPEVAAAIETALADVRRSPRQAGVWGQLGMVLVAHQFYDEGNFAFAQAERLDESDARWPYLHGLTLLLSDSEAAIGRLGEAVERQGDRAHARLLLAETFFVRGQGQEAEAHFRQVLQREPANARAHLGLARWEFARGNPSLCRGHLLYCQADPSAQKAAAFLFVEVLQRIGEHAAAARAREHAEQLPDDRPWPDPWRDEVDRLRVGRQARLERVDLLLATGRGDEALAVLEQLTRDHPNWPDGWLKLGRTLAEKQELERAERALRRAVDLAPRSIDAHFHLGTVQFMSRRFGEAEEQFRIVTELKPDHALAHYNRGHCLARQDRTADAVEAFQSALSIRPAFAAAHSSLGELLARLGKTEAAREHLRRAVELNPQDAAARQLLDRLGRTP